MAEQHEVVAPTELLDAGGRLVEPGWSRHGVWRYRRDRIRGTWWRVKEWDYYAVLDEHHGRGVTLTFSDLGYAGLFAVCLVDLQRGTHRQIDAIKPLTRGRAGLAADADTPHAVEVTTRPLAMRLDRDGDQRRLTFRADGIAGEVVLTQPRDAERMAIATSWPEDRTAFYYNQKIVGMPAEGRLTVGDDEVRFTPEHSFGILDWGRGRWTYRNRWYWSAAAGTVDGVVVGFTLGYGFSDRSAASENVIVHGGRVHKLGTVAFAVDPSDWLAPWHLRDEDGRLDLVLRPSLDRDADVNLAVIRSVQHQVFGYFDGTLTLDDGTRITVAGLPGFAERVVNRW